MRTRRNLRGYVRRHRILLGLLIMMPLVASGWIFWYGYSTHMRIEVNEASSRNELAKLDKRTSEMKAKKLAIEQARKEAETRAAAVNAAEQSRNGGTGGASAIDPNACNVSKKHNDPVAVDVLVNKKHCIQPLTFAPNDLVTTNGATLSAKAADAFTRLHATAAAAGQGFYVTSSYRSYADQVATYNHWVSVSGEAGADTYSARPGYSEHQTGLAFDVAANGCALDCLGSTSQYQWLQQNAAEYGFIQRYYAGYESITGYKAEEWHYRYVGAATAKDMKTKGVKTLEQYWNIVGGDY